MSAQSWPELAKTFREARKGKGLTQAELARRMGRPQPRISELEKARGDPRISTVLAAAAALGLELMAVPARLAPKVRYLLAGGAKPPAAQVTTVFEELYVPDPEDED